MSIRHLKKPIWFLVPFMIPIYVHLILCKQLTNHIKFGVMINKYDAWQPGTVFSMATRHELK